MTKRPQVYRVCAICGRRHGVTEGFADFLRRNGLAGSKAVKECVIKYAKTHKDTRR